MDEREVYLRELIQDELNNLEIKLDNIDKDIKYCSEMNKRLKRIEKKINKINKKL